MTETTEIKENSSTKWGWLQGTPDHEPCLADAPISRPLLSVFTFVVTDKQFTAPNFNLVNRKDLNRILQFEIFLHKDSQLRATHVILGYKPISSNFQSPKNIIKAKDPRLHLIDFAVPGFITSPPLEGTYHVNLPKQ
nr:hypothetical protein CFP56_59778 [Quercus suber]